MWSAISHTYAAWQDLEHATLLLKFGAALIGFGIAVHILVRSLRRRRRNR